jgi:hypothetical protein
VHGPALRQALERRQNFLDDEIERALALQCFEIRLRIVQPIGMIDAQTLQLLLRNESQRQPIRRLEYLRIFQPQRREVVHIE